MVISEAKLCLITFIVAGAIAVSFCSFCSANQLQSFKYEAGPKKRSHSHSAFGFLLFNSVVAAVVFLNGMKIHSCGGKLSEEMGTVCYVVKGEKGVCNEGIDDDDDDDDDDEGKEEMLEDDHAVDVFSSDGCSETYEYDDDDDDDIDAIDLEKRADEFIAKIVQGWMEERMKDKLTRSQ